MTCFPSIKTIAKECGYSVSTVKRALKDLEEMGYVEKIERYDDRKNGGQTSNLYVLKIKVENENNLCKNDGNIENKVADEKIEIIKGFNEDEKCDCKNVINASDFKKVFGIRNVINRSNCVHNHIIKRDNITNNNYLKLFIKIYDTS